MQRERERERVEVKEQAGFYHSCVKRERERVEVKERAGFYHSCVNLNTLGTKKEAQMTVAT
jgi:hypothetical protein